MQFLKLTTICFAGALTAATFGATAVQAQTNCDRTSTGGIVGGILGAGAGIAIGSQIGSGTGNKIAMGLGGLGGLLLGNELGRRMDCKSQYQAVNNQQSALENQPSGTSSNWKNPDKGYAGSTTPQQTFTNSSGQPCRKFVSTIENTRTGQIETVNGVACRRSDGKWYTQNS